jgi:hypothetical protein
LKKGIEGLGIDSDELTTMGREVIPMSEVTRFIVGAMALGYITYVMVFSKVAMPFRMLFRKALAHDSDQVAKVAGYFHDMLACPFCTGFWVTLAFQGVFRINPLGKGWLGLMLTAPALAIGAGYLGLATSIVLKFVPKRPEE